jgi:hypothetical protein
MQLSLFDSCISRAIIAALKANRRQLKKNNAAERLQIQIQIQNSFLFCKANYLHCSS